MKKRKMIERRPDSTKAKEPHDLYSGGLEIDELDEIEDDAQLASCWCYKHKVYEWHRIPISDFRDEED